LPNGKFLDFSGQALVMAIVNCTDDSFYPASRAAGEAALEEALDAEKEGAAIIDFGGESSRPGASYIGEEEELRRVIPAIKAFRKRSPLPVSVDTRKAAVARAAMEAGADIINDISALYDDPEMAAVCASSGAAVVLVHKKGEPLTMQKKPAYDDLPEELNTFFRAAIGRACAAGIPAGKIILDPGFGFGKNLEHNLELLRRIADKTNITGRASIAKIDGKEYPLLIGLSRKQFVGEITGRDTAGRLPGTLAANAAAILGGANIIRVHDVREHVDLAKVLFALRPGD